MNFSLLQLGSSTFALPSAAVREVLQHPVLSAVPLAPQVLAGMVLFRGEVLPVFDIGPLMDGPSSPSVVPPRVVVVQHNSVFAGIVADHASLASGKPVPDVEAPCRLAQALPLPAPQSSAPVLDVPALFQHFESCLATPI